MNLILSSRRAIKRQPLHIEVATLIRDMIMDGSLKQGEHIKELELCEELSVSRTPLREALKALHVEGLVTIETNRGSWVTKLTGKEYLETFEIISSLERRAIELVVKKASDEQISALKKMHDQMQIQFDIQNKMEYFALNQSIHKSIIHLSGNEKLEQLHQQLINLVTIGRYQAIDSDHRWEESMKEHQQFMSALISRDAVLAGEILSEHVMHTGYTLYQKFSEIENSQ